MDNLVNTGLLTHISVWHDVLRTRRYRCHIFSMWRRAIIQNNIVVVTVECEMRSFLTHDAYGWC